jgi:hypothetical protein
MYEILQMTSAEIFLKVHLHDISWFCFVAFIRPNSAKTMCFKGFHFFQLWPIIQIFVYYNLQYTYSSFVCSH